jgi:putative ABC transport system ATP-binding protein
MSMAKVLTLKNVSYQYEGTKKKVLRGINAAFEQGSVYAIVGKSGAGKSTLLSLISGLDVTTYGKILYGDGENKRDIKEIDRDDYRAQNVGVVFQGYNS